MRLTRSGFRFNSSALLRVIAYILLVFLLHFMGYTFSNYGFQIYIISFIPIAHILIGKVNLTLLVISYATTIKVLVIYTGLFELDPFMVDGEGYYNGYLSIEKTINAFFENPWFTISNTSFLYFGVGGYFKVLEHIFASTSFNLWMSFNQLLVFYSALLWINIVENKRIGSIAAILLVLSPDSVIFTTYLGKESILLFLSLLSVWCIKKYHVDQYPVVIMIFAGAIMLVGTFMRPYFSVLVLAYCTFLIRFYKNKYWLFFVLAGMLFILLSYRYNLNNLYLILRGFIANYLGLLLSPNFFRVVNWQNYFFETLFNFICLQTIILALLLRANTESVKDYMKSSFLYALPLSLAVIIYSHQVNPNVYAFYIPRSRFPMYMIYLHVVAQSIYCYMPTIKSIVVKK